MEDILICKNHSHKVQLICPICKQLMCYKCTDEHLGLNHGASMSLPFYAQKNCIPFYESLLKELEKPESNPLFSSLPFIKNGLLTIKKRLEEILQQLCKIIDFLSESFIIPQSQNETMKKAVSKEMKILVEAINNENMKYIANSLNFPETLNNILILENKENYIKTLQESISTVLKHKELDKLNQSLRDFQKDCEKIRISTGKNCIYGVFNPTEELNQIYKIDLEERKMTKIDKVHNECSVLFTRKKVFISGGNNPVINDLYELNMKSLKLFHKACMTIPKYYHSMIELGDSNIATIGGYGTIGSLCDCEEYSISNDKWTKLPSLNYPRCWPGVTLFKNAKKLFVIGGNDSNGTIEKMNLTKKDLWISIKLIINEVEFSYSPAAFNISDKEIMILAGGNSTDSAIFNVKEKTVKKCSYALKPDHYYFNSPICLENNSLCAIGSNGYIHIFKTKENCFEEIEYKSLIQ